MKKFLQAAVVILFVLSFVSTTSAHYIDLPVKWSQLPDMGANSRDFLSIHQANGPVVVNDWKCNQTGVIPAARWWGSYLDDANDGKLGGWKWFEVSVHPDNQGMPGLFANAAGNPYYLFQIVLAQEAFIGNTLGGDSIYRYDTYLNPFWIVGREGQTYPEPGEEMFWRQEEGNIYWMDIAYDIGQNNPQGAPPNQWGWHESRPILLSSAVMNAGAVAGNPHLDGWNPLGTDTAFEIMTPVPELSGCLAPGWLGFWR